MKLDSDPYYYIYQTTNLINGKFYIGKHIAKNIDDGYLGSGTKLYRAIKKYGKENFKRDIICFCYDRKELDETEANFVTQEFLDINKGLIYNIIPGGLGGSQKGRFVSEQRKARYRLTMMKPEIKTKTINNLRVAMQKQSVRDSISKGHKGKKKNLHKPKYKDKKSQRQLGSKRSNETKLKMSKSAMGENNSRYGTCWIHNLELGRSKSIKKAELNIWIEQGWIKGRVPKKLGVANE
jgi:hypothetical protein